jgi:cysteine desulfuration protein SufE
MEPDETSLEIRLQDIAEDFSLLGDWEERFRHLIDIGRALPELSEDERSEENRVLGCASKVWIVFDTVSPVITFRGDSDSVLVKGLIGLVHQLLNGLQPSQVTGLELKTILELLNLNQGLSVQRANGLGAMIQKLKTVAANS